MKPPVEIQPLLGYISRFVDFPAKEIPLLQTYFRSESIAMGASWLQQGEAIQEIGFVCEGLLRVFRTDQGREITLFLKKENDFTGSLTDYTNRKLSPYTVEAIEETRLLVISRSDQRQLLEKSAAYREFTFKVLEETATQAQFRVDSLISQRGHERYLGFLQNQTSLAGRVTQYHVASYLGLAPESLSRLRRLKLITNA